MIYAINKMNKEHRVLETTSDHALVDNILTWRVVEADKDGWIPWHKTDGSPLPEDQKCDVLIYGRRVVPHVVAHNNANWEGVTHYRPILEQGENAILATWDGETWPPPIGALLESRDASGVSIAEVIAIRGDKVIGCCIKNHLAGWLMKEDWTPFISKENREIKELHRTIMDYSKNTLFSNEMITLAEALYRKGYRKDGDDPQ